MKRLTRIIFVCAIVFVITSSLFASVAQAEPFWCDWWCHTIGDGCEFYVTCNCPMNQQLVTNCHMWCAGWCEVR
jgi:hypothetical protein